MCPLRLLRPTVAGDQRPFVVPAISHGLLVVLLCATVLWDTAGALRAHCGCTAGTCIKDHPEEKEGGNIKQHMRM